MASPCITATMCRGRSPIAISSRSGGTRCPATAGVFMENIVNVQMQSGEAHDLSAHAGMAHGRYGHGGAAASKFKALDKDDLLYPCDIMADRASVFVL